MNMSLAKMQPAYKQAYETKVEMVCTKGNEVVIFKL